jgi:putative transposase
MTQYKITVNKNILHHLLSSNDEGMKELLKQILDQILEQQRTEQINAERYERTEERRGRRNGYKTRNLITRVGTITLRIPQIRDGVFSTDLFKRYQRSEQALVLALMEMVINGVSTRKVAAITEELCGTSFSASTVSALCKRLDPIVNGWNERPLSGSLFPFIIVDAIVIKIRENNRVCPHSALIAIGVNEDGYREILGMKIGNSETEESWSEFFTWLKGRGLRGVDFVASDNHGGLVNAVARCFQGATWQRCQTHFTRNILDNCPKRMKNNLHGHLRSIFEAPNLESARSLLHTTIDTFAAQAPKAVDILEQGFDDATAVLILPERYRKRLRTTNSIERLNEEIRRRERVIRIFPNHASAARLIGALLMEQDEIWSTGRKYFDMDEYWQWKRQQKHVNKVTHLNTARQF